MLNLPMRVTPLPAVRDDLVAVDISPDGRFRGTDSAGNPVPLFPPGTSGFNFAMPDPFPITGTGPYEVAETPDGALVICFGDGNWLRPGVDYTRTGRLFTLSAGAATYTELAIIYTY